MLEEELRIMRSLKDKNPQITEAQQTLHRINMKKLAPKNMWVNLLKPKRKRRSWKQPKKDDNSIHVDDNMN